MKLFSRLSRSSDNWAQMERQLAPGEPVSLPPGLHERIMGAARTTHVEPAASEARWPLALAGASVCAAIVGVVVWVGMLDSADSPAQAAAMPSLNSDLPIALSKNLFSPLAVELARVEADMRNAAQGVLSAMPQFPSDE